MNSDFSDFIRFFPIFRLFPTFRLLDSTTLFLTHSNLGNIVRNIARIANAVPVTLYSRVTIRPVESKSLKVGKSLKIGKNRIKLEKSE